MSKPSEEDVRLAREWLDAWMQRGAQDAIIPELAKLLAEARQSERERAIKAVKDERAGWSSTNETSRNLNQRVFEALDRLARRLSEGD